MGPTLPFLPTKWFWTQTSSGPEFFTQVRVSRAWELLVVTLQPTDFAGLRDTKVILRLPINMSQKNQEALSYLWLLRSPSKRHSSLQERWSYSFLFSKQMPLLAVWPTQATWPLGLTCKIGTLPYLSWLLGGKKWIRHLKAFQALNWKQRAEGGRVVQGGLFNSLLLKSQAKSHSSCSFFQ